MSQEILCLLRKKCTYKKVQKQTKKQKTKGKPRSVSRLCKCQMETWFFFAAPCSLLHLPISSRGTAWGRFLAGGICGAPWFSFAPGKGRLWWGKECVGPQALCFLEEKNDSAFLVVRAHIISFQGLDLYVRKLHIHPIYNC